MIGMGENAIFNRLFSLNSFIYIKPEVLDPMFVWCSVKLAKIHLTLFNALCYK